MGGLVESFSVFFWTLGLELGFNFIKKGCQGLGYYIVRGDLFFLPKGVGLHFQPDFSSADSSKIPRFK